MVRRRARRWWTAGALIAAIMVAVVATSVTLASGPSVSDVTAAVKALPMFDQGKFTQHLVVPRDEAIVDLLVEKGIPLKTGALKAQAVQAFRQEWAQRNPTTPNPHKLEKILKNEQAGAPVAVTASTFMSLVVPVEFPATETFLGWDGSSITATGPLHNEIPAPGPKDNNTIWYNDSAPTLYNELYFGVGPAAGVVVNHPNLGTVDLRGNTMANYYLEQSEGKFQPHGAVYPNWLQAAHPEAWYGNDKSETDNSPRASDLVKEVVDALNADDPSFNWAQYDGDGDGIVDNFTVIHAGMGQEAGGGQQGTDAIWSHASAIDYPTGYLACPAGTNGAPRDIYVREYSMDPENLDVGVIAEEYGHAAFGLPDIYTTDAQASVSNWAIMEAGSWNGILGGMQPAPFPLYFRYVIGWASPTELNYNSKPTTLKVGQLSLRPKGTKQGIKINLPDTVVTVPNNAGSGQAWWSTKSDLADFYLAHDFDLSLATGAVTFSFASYWSIEEGFDYGYVEVSEDSGANWTKLQDTSGFMVLDEGGTGTHYGLSGEGSGTVTFDLSAYAGKSIRLRLRYVSDMAVQWDGWWADDISLTDASGTLFTDDVETPPGAWSTNAFQIVPQTNSFPLYYLAEWRNLSGFDRGLKYPYVTVYNDENTNEWQVDRAPYTAPGMLLWVRNAAYDFDYTLYDSIYDAPSWGAKHALLVVDSHYWPLEWDTMGLYGVPLRLNSRAQPGNATFTLQPTKSFTIRMGYDPFTGDWVDPAYETKKFASLPGVSQFHDSLGYQPGFRYHFDAVPDNEGLYWWDKAASTVIPVKGDYSTKITDDAKAPFVDFYGIDIGGTITGTGDPRDAGVQYGVNLAVLDKAKDGSWGTIAFWNAKQLGDVSMTATQSRGFMGRTITYTLVVKNISPAPQPLTLTDVIPGGTTFLKGRYFAWSGLHFDSATDTLTWSGNVPARGTRTFTFTVKVDNGTPWGTSISNTAVLGDDANGDTATKTVKIGK